MTSSWRRSFEYVLLWLLQSAPLLLCDYWPTVNFANKCPFTLSVDWVSSDGSVKHIVDLPVDHEVGQNTHVGHRFRFSKKDDTSIAHVEVKITSGGRVAVTNENSALKAIWVETVQKRVIPEKAKKLADLKKEECVENLHAAIASGNDPNATEDEAVFCQKFPEREVIVSKATLSRAQWERNMQEPWRTLKNQWQTQPAGLRNFTSSGFKLLRRNPKSGPAYGGLMSDEFYEAMGTIMDWYEIHRLNARPEEHGIMDPSVSSYESDTWVVHPPPHLSHPLKVGIKQGLEKWAGLPENGLQFIAFYGPRLYRNNSVLRRHVDIWETHVLSAVIAVGRRGLQRPWPLEILDHNGNQHAHQDHPGDVTLYESATCAHSRQDQPLLGREVANIFVHFKPRHDWTPIEGSTLKPNVGKLKAGEEL